MPYAWCWWWRPQTGIDAHDEGTQAAKDASYANFTWPNNDSYCHLFIFGDNIQYWLEIASARFCDTARIRDYLAISPMKSKNALPDATINLK